MCGNIQGGSWLCSQRVTLAVIGFLGVVNLYALRVNLSVAIICMVNHTAAYEDISDWNSTLRDDHLCMTDRGDTALQTTEDGELHWDKFTQGLVLGSFFWGYIFTQIPGGWLASRYGGKRVLGWSMFTSACLTLLMPTAAKTHPVFLMVLRVLAGLCQGVVWPSMHALWAYWAPPLERTTLIGFNFGGAQFGNAVTLPIAGLLCKYGFAGGWPSVFYVLGGCGIVWFITWMIFVYDTPEQHPRISTDEKRYIQHALSGQTKRRIKPDKIPWLAFVKSPAVWGLIVTNTCVDWAIYTFMTNLPTYMKEVLYFDINKNGFLSSLPYLGMWSVIVASAVIADILRKRKILSTTVIRKASIAIGMLLPAVLCIAIGFVDCTQSITGISLLFLTISISGFSVGSGYAVNHADIAPKYAGLLYGISNTVASIPGFVAPTLIGIITKDKTQAQWRIVFFITAAITSFGSIFYMLTGSGEIQEWGRDDTDNKDEVDIMLNEGIKLTDCSVNADDEKSIASKTI